MSRTRREAICVLAPAFSSEDTDGYLRRIRAVDDKILSSMERFYLMGDRPGLGRERLSPFAPSAALLEFDSGSFLQRRRVFSRIRESGRLYIHSAYRLFAGNVSPRLEDVLRLPGVRVIWDVHGAVSEETVLCAGPELARRAARAEELLYRRSDGLVSVSAAMEAHLAEKFGPFRGRTFCLPLFEACGPSAQEGRKPLSRGRPVAVYAGGLQPWQNIPDLLDLASRTGTEYDWRLLVPDRPTLDRLWGGRPGQEGVQMRSGTPDQVGRELERAHYGLLLRGDSIVNRVACPTKLAEYIRAGAVPVLRTARIGDMERLGIEYVREEDFARGAVPPEQERAAMAARNRQRWAAYERAAADSAAALRQWILERGA